jgi:hypothetical protein
VAEIEVNHVQLTRTARLNEVGGMNIPRYNAASYCLAQ